VKGSRRDRSVAYRDADLIERHDDRPPDPPRMIKAS
jgi:hypothetical protein